ncbi:hypothetical protein H0H92_002046 [Tricholoma furcatifolium]|nr:hypothetical protein H0H92_002046 [Tricholoma furcatifolium]
MSSTSSVPKTVVVLGAAYGGPRAAQILAAGVPEGWRVLLIDRNSHTNNVYILPRLSVLPGHEHKAFISNSNVFRLEHPSHVHRRLQATVTSISKHSLTLSKSFPEYDLPTSTIPFDYMIYALGSHLPAPLNLWGLDSGGKVISTTPVKGKQLPVYQGMKSEGIAWLKERQKIVEASMNVLVVGGGALGIQYATDIATIYPTKKVTLLHSRMRLLPRFDEGMHSEILTVMESMDNLDVILGERLDLSFIERQKKLDQQGQRVLRTTGGREIACDLTLLCTGQTPNTNLLKEFDSATVNPSNSLAHVLRTLQLGVLRSSEASVDDLDTALKQISISMPIEEPLEATPYPHIFVVGDAADAFSAIPAGHNAYYQGEVAARNILRLIKRSDGASEEDEPLEQYIPGPPAIKVSLGLVSVFVARLATLSRNPQGKAVFQSQGIIGRQDGAPDDLNAASMWPMFGIPVTHDDEMYQ